MNLTISIDPSLFPRFKERLVIKRERFAWSGKIRDSIWQKYDVYISTPAKLMSGGWYIIPGIQDILVDQLGFGPVNPRVVISRNSYGVVSPEGLNVAGHYPIRKAELLARELTKRGITPKTAGELTEDQRYAVRALIRAIDPGSIRY